MSQIDELVIDADCSFNAGTKFAPSMNSANVHTLEASADSNACEDNELLNKLLKLKRPPARQILEGRIQHFTSSQEAVQEWCVTTNSALSERADKLSHKLYLLVKRAFDLTVAGLMLLLLFPFALLISLLIYLEDKGPVLYYQIRIGKNGKRIKFYKFRSMVINADALKEKLREHNESDGPVFKMKNDPRITKVGRWIRKTSADELPQLLTVLTGDMSIIGPRPLIVEEADVVGERFDYRHRVEPGLLCLREICGRSALSFNERMELDVLYVNTRSFMTDLRIFLHSIPVVLRSDGAY